MILKYTKRMLTETNKRLLWKFTYNFGIKGLIGVNKFQKRLKKGEHFPAFLFLSITNKCNLKCQGCWVSQTNPANELDLETLDKIINDSKKQGVYFYGILGGEPLLHKGLFEIFNRHQDCYFLLFTNGIMMNESVADKMVEVGNVSPLISIEGDEIVSDVRRGGKEVYSKTLEGIKLCRDRKIIIGTATSVCKSNIDSLATKRFLDELIDLGVHYHWYYIYRPVGPDPAPELSLSSEEVYNLRKFMVDVRGEVPIMVVDSYWDHNGEALCAGATGIGHHISPEGDIEVCPPIQFAKEKINNNSNVFKLFNESKYLAEFRNIVPKATRGCIIMENPDLMEKIIKDLDVGDSSGRNTALKELQKMTCRSSHDMKELAIPEKYWIYKFAKKNWFFGFGAYG